MRDVLGIGFPGGTYAHLFYVADVAASGPVMDGELHVALDDADFLAVFPMAGSGRARLIGTVREETEARREPLAWQDVSPRMVERLSIQVERVNWFSTYHVHHRVADHFQQGRVFLLGDAAHIHSPVGGQGMNTGIGDAVNLAWKLAAVLQGRAETPLLHTYEPERIAFARRLVATTDRAFTVVTSPGPFARVCPRRGRATPAASPVRVAIRAPFHVPHDLADRGDLSWQPLERGPRRQRQGRRPPALGHDGQQRGRGGRQFRAAEITRLAGSRLW